MIRYFICDECEDGFFTRKKETPIKCEYCGSDDIREVGKEEYLDAKEEANFNEMLGNEFIREYEFFNPND